MVTLDHLRRDCQQLLPAKVHPLRSITNPVENKRLEMGHSALAWANFRAIPVSILETKSSLIYGRTLVQTHTRMQSTFNKKKVKNRDRE